MRPNKDRLKLRQRLIGESSENTIIVENVEVKALIDTGSMVSTISESYYYQMENRPDLQDINDFELNVTDANGNEIPYLGYIEAEVRIPNSDITGLFVPLLVVKSTEYNRNIPIIVGTNIIRECARWYDTLSPEGIGVPLEWKAAFEVIGQSCVGKVKATKDITIRPMEVKTVTGFIRKNYDVDSAVTEDDENAGPDKPTVCPRVVTLSNPGRTARIPVRICNMSAKTITIRAKSTICQLQVVEVLRHAPIFESASSDEALFAGKETNLTSEDPFVHQQTEMEAANSNATTQDIASKIKTTYGVDLHDSDLSTEQQEKVLKLFEKWKSVFPKTPMDLGHTSAVKHKIELTNNEPFKEPYRRIPPALFNEVKQHLHEMLDIGAIRESKSPWSSNVVIVRKKDGTIRFCIDFRKLNARTRKDAYGIPRVEDTLHMLAGAKYFSKLDMKAGYWQVELQEEDKEKTAFQAAGLGFYECNRMPFGLCNAPATFQRLMERCMGDLNLRDCLIYLDDIIIFSQDIDSHIDRLDLVFQRLAEYQLKIKPSKCEFFQKETTYLGHVVSEEGIRADPKKSEVVKNWPTPQTVKQVRQFLGFAGYYRRFIKGFASIARPLNNLLIGISTKKQRHTVSKKIKRTPFKWDEPQQRAFDNIKEQLTSPPILAYADYSKPFTLHVDASFVGLGAVLYQRQGDHDRVIAYASRSLKQSETNYPAHKLEFLALKWSVTEKFHDYLYGAKFEVVTDNNPLTYVNSTAKLDATGHRWLAALSNYNYTARYRKGKHHIDADGLSRIIPREVIQAVNNAATADTIPMVDTVQDPDNPMPQTDVNISEDTLHAYSLSSKDWSAAQAQDSILSKIAEHIRNGTKPAKPMDRSISVYLREWPLFIELQGVLYRKTCGSDDERLQLLLPEELRSDVFKALHDDLGHQGRDRTTSLFKERFYWPGMGSFIADNVRNCDRCIRRKSLASTAELTPIKSMAPMETVCIDYLSLERSKGGFENILVLTDHFSRYAQAFPTRNQTAKTTARVLFDNFVVHYGFPARIHSDQGRNFESTLIKELCSLARVEKTRTTPYHAMGNGMVERFNQTLLKMLGTLEEHQKSDWKAHVPGLVHAYNATRHESTGFSPYFLMFGRHPRLAIDAFLGLPTDSLTSGLRSEYVVKLRDRLRSAYAKAREIAAKTSSSNKARYDDKARSTVIYPGDRVLVRNVTIRGKQKLADKWEHHPYIVLRQPIEDMPVYEVKREGSRFKKSRTLHRNLLLPFMTTTDRIEEAPRTDDDVNTGAVDDPHEADADDNLYLDVIDDTDSEIINAFEDESETDEAEQMNLDSGHIDKGSVQSVPRYIIPRKRKPGDVGLSPPSRPVRQHKQPKWLTTGDWKL